MLSNLLNAVGSLGNLVDLPGSSVRDVLAFKNPFDQYLSPFANDNRTSGRDLLRQHGLIGQQDTWGNFVGGLAVEAAVDPLNWIPGRALMNSHRARGVVADFNKGIRAGNATSIAQRADGFMPAEIARATMVRNGAGTPQRMYHGTNTVFDRYDPLRDSGENLYGKGYYHTDAPEIASTYAGKEGTLTVDNDAKNVLQKLAQQYVGNSGTQHRYINQAIGYLNRTDDPNPVLLNAYLDQAKLPPGSTPQVVTNAPLNVRMQYLDIRNPFDVEAVYNRSKLLNTDGRPMSRVRTLEIEQNRDRLRHLVSDYRKQRPTGQTKAWFHEKIRDAFENRNPSHEIGGEDYLNHIAEQGSRAAIMPTLKRSGYDGIIHKGGKVTGGEEHNVAIAFDPSQVYKPYIARELQPELRTPTRKPAGLGLAAYTALARNRRRDQ